MSTTSLPQTEDERRFDAMLAAASKICDERLREALSKAAGDSSNVEDIIGEECEEMMREGLPPIDTPNTTEDGQPRAITISSGLG
jgi:hypothetical protein